MLKVRNKSRGFSPESQEIFTAALPCQNSISTLNEQTEAALTPLYYPRDLFFAVWFFR